MQIKIRGKDFEAELPALDIREDLVYSYGKTAKQGGVPYLRVCAAMVGLCVPEVLFSLKKSTNGARADLAEWGSEIYIALREKGWQTPDLAAAGVQLIPHLIRETFPREEEVEAARGNSEGGGRSSAEKPSA